MNRARLVVALLAAAPSVAGALCTTLEVAGTGVAFGTFLGSQRTSSGKISLTCTGEDDTYYSVALSTGMSGSYSQRTMRNGMSALSYNLYADSAFATIWGDGTGGTVTMVGTISLHGGKSRTVDLTVYGRLPAQILLPPGAYSDAITTTVTY